MNFDEYGSMHEMEHKDKVNKVKIIDGSQLMAMSMNAGGRNTKLSERGFMSFFTNPFKMAIYDKKLLNKMYDDWLELPLFGTTMVICISQVLTRTKEIEKVIWNNTAEMDIVKERYDGDQKAYNREMNLNFLVTLILTIVGLLNAWLIKRYSWYRDPVPIVNTFVVLSYLPLFNTYNFDEIFMFFIPMHIFHVLCCFNCCQKIWQMIVSCLILFAWDFFYLIVYIADSDRIYENRYNLVVFFNIYLISTVSWGIFFINSQKRAFLGQLVISNLNQEFFGILNNFPEGVLIAQVEKSKSEESRNITFTREMQ